MTGLTRFSEKRGRLGCNLAAGQEAAPYAQLFLRCGTHEFHLCSCCVCEGKVVEHKPKLEGGILRKRSDKGLGLLFVCLTLELAR